MDNNCVKYHPHPSYPWKVKVWKQIFAMCKSVTLTLAIWLWVNVMIQLCEILWISNMAVRSYMARTQIFGICALWPWAWRYDIRSRSWTHPWVIDNKCVKYHPDPTWKWEVMARTQILGICGKGWFGTVRQNLQSFYRCRYMIYYAILYSEICMNISNYNQFHSNRMRWYCKSFNHIKHLSQRGRMVWVWFEVYLSPRLIHHYSDCTSTF